MVKQPSRIGRNKARVHSTVDRTSASAPFNACSTRHTSTAQVPQTRLAPGLLLFLLVRLLLHQPIQTKMAAAEPSSKASGKPIKKRIDRRIWTRDAVTLRRLQPNPNSKLAKCNQGGRTHLPHPIIKPYNRARDIQWWVEHVSDIIRECVA